MRGYPFPEQNPSGRVTRLEDRDGDGRFETRTVFLDGLSWPTGIIPYAGGVFVAVAPDIVYAKDTTGDGVADVKKVMFTGFGTDNVQGLLNGLLWGPDGWIYGVASINGGTIQQSDRGQSRHQFPCEGEIFASSRTARHSKRSRAADSSVIPSTTGDIASPAATATTSGKSFCHRITSSATLI